MKTITVVLNVGNMPYASIALKAIEKYYTHIGVPVHVLTEHFPETVATSPVWMKCLLHDHFGADMRIAQDLDIVPCNLKYDIQDFLIKDQISMAIDSTRIGMGVKEGNAFPHFKYNAGMTVIPKSKANFFKRVFLTGSIDPHNWKTFDQYYINEALGNEDVFVNELPQIFNAFWHEEIDFNRTAMCHYTNRMATKQKADFISTHHPKEMLS